MSSVVLCLLTGVSHAVSWHPAEGGRPAPPQVYVNMSSHLDIFVI